jgi:hypothetical protein
VANVESNLMRPIRLMVQITEGEAIARAAEIMGMSQAAWMRFVIRAAAAEELRKAGEHPPFLPVPKGKEIVTPAVA